MTMILIVSLALRRCSNVSTIFARKTQSTGNEVKPHVSNLCNLFNINRAEAEFLGLKHPVVTKLNTNDIEALINVVQELGYNRQVLTDWPVLFGFLPITLKYRHQVLQECGVRDISPAHIGSYLTIVKQRTIEQHKKAGLISAAINVENRLAGYMTQWPTSLTTLIYGHVDQTTLYHIRLKIIQRYLELVLDLTEEEFRRGIKTYPTIKHRPLALINETLTILQSSIMIPNHKIKSNLYLIHADPDNLKHILYKFKSIGGIDIKEILRLHPKLAQKNCQTLVEIRNILQAFGITNEAQVRCFELFTLSPATVRERLSSARDIPEFEVLFNHPRFLKMIFHNTTAIQRLRSSYKNNKKCLSLNILSGSSTFYKLFEKTPGDRAGKGKDLVFCLSEVLGKTFKSTDIRNMIKRHPFWINVPIVQVKYVYGRLAKDFTSKEIFENCAILLYPWNKVQKALKQVNPKTNGDQCLFADQLDYVKLNQSQRLSLVLYLLERNHYFSGNGIWTEEQKKNIVDVPLDKLTYSAEY